MGRIKKPRQEIKQQGLIRNKETTVDELPDRKNPIFSFYLLSKNYCLSQCTRDEKAALVDTLHELSQLMWAQIKQAPRHGKGCEKLMRGSIREPIPSHIKDDVTFLAFRFNGKAPMVGYRDGVIFHILWIDRTFTLYKH